AHTPETVQRGPGDVRGIHPPHRLVAHRRPAADTPDSAPGDEPVETDAHVHDDLAQSTLPMASPSLSRSPPQPRWRLAVPSTLSRKAPCSVRSSRVPPPSAASSTVVSAADVRTSPALKA